MNRFEAASFKQREATSFIHHQSVRGAMKEERYQGWRNFETWAVALWMDNESSSYAHWRAEARRHYQEAPTTEQVVRNTWTAEEAARFNLPDDLKDAVEGNCPILVPSMYVDLLHGALSEVDWNEIAARLLDEVQEESKEEQPPRLPCGIEFVHQYSRADALADGTLRDISEMAREAGIKYPTAMTAAAWHLCVHVPEGGTWNEEQGRLWDVLSVMYHAMQSRDGKDRIDFQVVVQTAEAERETMDLYALCHPGDDGETPVMTVMLRGED